MLYLLYCFAIILSVKFIINWARYIQCKQYFDKYRVYIKKPDWEFNQHQLQIIELFKKAGIEDSIIPVIEPLGYGYVGSSNTSVFKNITNTREDIVALTFHFFHQAIGTYRSRMFEVFSPIYWVEFIIYLPKQTLIYLGVPPENMVVKIAQIFYWFVSIVLGFLLGLFRPEIEQLVKDWIKRP
jgi:hypothetical protein